MDQTPLRMLQQLSPAAVWKTRLYLSHRCCQQILEHAFISNEETRMRRMKVTQTPIGLFHQWYVEVDDWFKRFWLSVDFHGTVPTFEEWTDIVQFKHPDSKTAIQLALPRVIGRDFYVNGRVANNLKKPVCIAPNTPTFTRMRDTFQRLSRTYHARIVQKAEHMGPPLKQCRCTRRHDFHVIELPIPSESEDDEDEDVSETTDDPEEDDLPWPAVAQ